VQLPVPEQAPDQPAKNAPFAGVAVSLTEVPELKDAVQVGAQLTPAGLLVTVPVELPANVTDTWYVVVGGADAPRGPEVPAAALQSAATKLKLAARRTI